MGWSGNFSDLFTATDNIVDPYCYAPSIYRSINQSKQILYERIRGA